MITAGAEALDIGLSAGQADLLLRYCALVRDWNQRINLVSRRDIGNLATAHVLDSLAAVPLITALNSKFEIRNSKSAVLDLGSGGGLPGIPLRICRPEISLTCLESTQKKVRFLETAVLGLGLDRVTVVPIHSNEMPRDSALWGSFDVVLARAVAELRELVPLCFPFLKPGGQLLAWKGSRADEEIAAAARVLQKHGGSLERRHDYELPGVDRTRCILAVRKG